MVSRPNAVSPLPRFRLNEGQTGVAFNLRIKVKDRQGSEKMLGWIIVFALVPLGAIVVMVAGQPVPFCLKLASLVFATLFFFSLLTSAIGSRARY